MSVSHNSINAPVYKHIKQELDAINSGKYRFWSDIDVSGIPDLPLAVSALFVAIKETKYREPSLLLLNQLINFNTPRKILEVLKSDKLKAFNINSNDLDLQQRKEIVGYMLRQKPDPYFHEAVIFSLGFFLTPDLSGWLKTMQQNSSGIVRQEIEYALNFLANREDRIFTLNTGSS